MRTKLVVCLLILFFSGANRLVAEDFMFKAIVDSHFVLLTWDEQKSTDGFNVYRKTVLGSYTRLNALPITPLSKCADITSAIPPGSAEATAISTILSVPACEINKVPALVTANWYKARKALSLRYYKIAEVRGLAYEDHGVTYGQKYLYMIKSVKDGVEKIIATDLEVTADVTPPLKSPPSVKAEAGDCRVFVTWEKIPDAITYEVLRSTTALGPSTVITPASGVSGLYKHNPITNDTMLVHKPGFLDTACVNNTTYYYKVRGIDFLGHPGKLSAAVDATPRDKTPPASPSGIMILPLTKGLKLTWSRVDSEIVSHHETVMKYTIYRYTNYENASKDILGALAGTTTQPADSITNVNFEDNYPIIQPETTYWYRICCEDDAIPAHNFSNKSSPVSGFYKDPFPPAPPTGLTTDAYEDSILLRWNPPADADLAGFDIYRGICGCETIYVFRKNKPQTLTHMVGMSETETVELTENRSPGAGWVFIGSYCRPYSLALIANIDSAGARYYPDRSVPKGSPICYRYAMKAYDKSQNPSVMSDSLCDRLKDRTGPTPPVIAGLLARDRAILVQWVSPPIQDLYGFIVERALDPSGPWDKVSPDLPVPDPASIRCGTVPATNNWADSTFSFLDTKSIDPKINYWYRVKGVDYMGNRGDASPEIGTFSYDRHLPAQPMNLKVVDTTHCTATLVWDPAYKTDYLGFVVFRSKKFDSGYRQVSPILRENKFTDEHLAQGETYYYQVQYYAKDGNRSKPSAPKIHKVN